MARDSGRFFGFAAVGVFVFLLGIGLLWFCVNVLRINVQIAYAIQAVVSIETSFFLNNFLNWKDREGSLLTKWLRFHLAKLGTVIVDQVLFAIFLHFGINYLVIKVMNTMLATVLSYTLNEYFVFGKGGCSNEQLAKSNNPGSM